MPPYICQCSSESRFQQRGWILCFTTSHPWIVLIYSADGNIVLQSKNFSSPRRIRPMRYPHTHYIQKIPSFNMSKQTNFTVTNSRPLMSMHLLCKKKQTSTEFYISNRHELLIRVYVFSYAGMKSYCFLSNLFYIVCLCVTHYWLTKRSTITIQGRTLEQAIWNSREYNDQVCQYLFTYI